MDLNRLAFARGICENGHVIFPEGEGISVDLRSVHDAEEVIEGLLDRVVRLEPQAVVVPRTFNGRIASAIGWRCRQAAGKRVCWVVHADKRTGEIAFPDEASGFGPEEILEGRRCVVLDDAARTGETLMRMIWSVRAHGGIVEAALVIVRCPGIAAADLGVPRFEALAQTGAAEPYAADRCPACRLSSAALSAPR